MNAGGDDGPMLEVVDVVHHYGATLALDHVSVAARRGEFLTVLGESGSGKTTLLRVISGLEHPTSVQRLAIGGEDVRALPAARRNCTTVFQSYALFPHMSVAENVGYGLKIRGVPREETRQRVAEALAMVRLGEKGQRRIHQLSGGERQRVALARALVTHPAVLLLDEPLGALDERLRVDMQTELVELQRRLGVTFVYITHSQEEALSMSDRIVLMRRGRIEQSGTPEALFDQPVSRFAAQFMGFENILRCTVRGREGERLVVAVGDAVLRGRPGGDAPLPAGSGAFLAIRAERLRPLRGEAADGANVLAARQSHQVYRGKYVDETVETAAGALRLRRWEMADASAPLQAVAWLPEDGVVLPDHGDETA